jgi:hypothetical protein
MTAEHTPKKVKVLTRLKITEVSAVDRGAGENCKIVLSKRDDSDSRLNLVDVFKGKITAAQALGIHVNKSAEGDEAEGLIAAPKKHRSITFDTVDGTRMKFPNERSLAEWLAIQSRIRKSNHEDPTMPVNLSDVVKNHGVVALAKYMVEQNSSFGATEAELVELATADAHRRSPESTPEVAFASLYEKSAELRAAIEVCKNAMFEDAMSAELERDSQEAIKELTAIGKAKWPNLSPAQRFARAFETSPELAKRAHRRPGPSTSFAPVAKEQPTVLNVADIMPRTSTEENMNDPAEALAQLRQLGRDRWPTESEAQQFLNAMTTAEFGPLIRRALGRPTRSTPPRQ